MSFEAHDDPTTTLDRVDRASADGQARETLEWINGTLHNIGNVLNSVGVSTDRLLTQLGTSRHGVVAKVAGLLQEHADDLPAFLESERGRQLPVLLAALADRLQAEHDDVKREVLFLKGNVEHMRSVLTAQQEHAREMGKTYVADIVDMVKVALDIHRDRLTASAVQVSLDCSQVPNIPIDRHRVLQILLNLLGNALDALEESRTSDRRLDVRVEAVAEGVAITVGDNGVGMTAEQLARVFEHGFTTKERGHGFGLHSSIRAAQAMGGKLVAHSDGPGTGASFTLELPMEESFPSRSTTISAHSWRFGPVTRQEVEQIIRRNETR